MQNEGRLEAVLAAGTVPRLSPTALTPIASSRPAAGRRTRHSRPRSPNYSRVAPCSQSTAVRAYIKSLPIYENLVSFRPMNPSQLFHPAVAQWFVGRFVQPTPAQAQAWPAIKAGRHTLIAAPTGSGKTLAAFLAAIDDLVRQGVAGGLAATTQVVYVSPLKALSNDIQRNLEAPLAGIRAELRRSGLPDVEIRTLVRTGDTSSSER